MTLFAYGYTIIQNRTLQYGPQSAFAFQRTVNRTRKEIGNEI